MSHELKLIISEKGETINTLIKETDTDPKLLLKSLEEFKVLANEALTKLIGQVDNENSVEKDANSECGEEDSNSECDEEDANSECDEKENYKYSKRKRKL